LTEVMAGRVTVGSVTREVMAGRVTVGSVMREVMAGRVTVGSVIVESDICVIVVPWTVMPGIVTGWGVKV